MRVAISGASGLIGRTLKEHFLKNAHEVSEISRHRGIFNNQDTILWNLKEETIDAQALEDHDIIVHLAGADISAQKWTKAYKKEILQSRVSSTKTLVHAIKDLSKRPKIVFTASAVGFYGNHDPFVPLNEHSSCGTNFLAQVCHEWENASADLILYGIRLIHMRFGVVLSNRGGALTKMLPVFYCGLGGRLGSGGQKMSWIAIDEIPAIIDYIIAHDQISGPVNFVAPNPVTNKQFTKTLGKVLFRPTILPVPAFVIRSLFGQMGKELLLEGAHVTPKVLLDTGYQFQYPDLEKALRKVL